MRSFKRFMFSIIGIIIFVIMPSFYIISNHLEKSFPGNDYAVTHLTGQAFVQYRVSHKVTETGDTTGSYDRKSEWIPLAEHMKIGSGALIETRENTSLDIMKNNEVAIRIQENSRVEFKLVKAGNERTEASLNAGKLFCQVDDKKNNGSEHLRIQTPTASAHVHGTSFSIAYHPDNKVTRIDVLEGLVTAQAEKFFDMELKIRNGRQLVLDPAQGSPVFGQLRSETIRELHENRDIKIAPTITDRWDEAVFFVSAMPMFRKALIEITKYEMKVFIRALRYFARLRWNNRAPNSIREVKLEDGDYKDPWNTDYLYEKLAAQTAVLISAGPDKHFHTSDDIFMAIHLN